MEPQRRQWHSLPRGSLHRFLLLHETLPLPYSHRVLVPYVRAVSTSSASLPYIAQKISSGTSKSKVATFEMGSAELTAALD